jgi:nucleosome binding factor SPN SPT16 subunit
LSQIEGKKGIVPVEIFAQAKAKEAPNDSLSNFFQLYSSFEKVGTLTKEQHSGKLMSEWEKLVGAAASKPALVDMAPAVSAFMAVKDEEEMVRDSM